MFRISYTLLKFVLLKAEHGEELQQCNGNVQPTTETFTEPQRYFQSRKLSELHYMK